MCGMIPASNEGRLSLSQAINEDSGSIADGNHKYQCRNKDLLGLNDLGIVIGTVPKILDADSCQECP